MNPGLKEKVEAQFEVLRNEAFRRRDVFQMSPAPKIHIGLATCGIAAGALDTQAAFEQTLKERNIDAHVHTVGCLGHCYAEPVVIIEHPESGFPPIFYHEVTAGKAKMLTKMFIEGGDKVFGENGIVFFSPGSGSGNNYATRSRKGMAERKTRAGYRQFQRYWTGHCRTPCQQRRSCFCRCPEGRRH